MAAKRSHLLYKGMLMEIKKAEFVISVHNISQLPSTVKEIAIAGKSNVGKSSFINFICNNSKLAKTSKEPGRTRALNYYNINGGEFSLVDLPGYGFAKVPKAEKKKWATLLESYFQLSKKLKHVFLLLDIRHKPTEYDNMMLSYMNFYNLPFTIIATKADKLSRAACGRQLVMLSSALGVGKDNIIPISSTEKTGKERVLERIDQALYAQSEQD